MVTLHDAVNSVYFILNSSFDTHLLHFFLPVHSLFLLYTWKTDHTNGHEVINFTGQYWLCRKVCVTLCFVVANVIHYNCVYCNNIAWHCHDLVVHWRHLFSYIKYILLVRHLGFVCVLLYIARSGLLHLLFQYLHQTSEEKEEIFCLSNECFNLSLPRSES